MKTEHLKTTHRLGVILIHLQQAYQIAPLEDDPADAWKKKPEINAVKGEEATLGFLQAHLLSQTNSFKKARKILESLGQKTFAPKSIQETQEEHTTLIKEIITNLQTGCRSLITALENLQKEIETRSEIPEDLQPNPEGLKQRINLTKQTLQELENTEKRL